jgi:hypothetical protein
VGPALDVVQHEDEAASPRQLLDRAIDIDRQLQRAAAVDTAVQHRVSLTNLTPIRPETFPAAVDNDAGQPRAERGLPPESLERSNRADPGVVYGIFGVVAAMREQTQGERVKRRRVSPVERAKRSLVTRTEESCDQGSIVGFRRRGHLLRAGEY